ncbi:syntaxin-1A-like isoform X2 [Centruroides vittatus]|uniref:syntaxin-1A-like isoform X2 n=1 Tax=Centruroides vittatus TaxID=120091 RepID=UPI0035104C7E
MVKDLMPKLQEYLKRQDQTSHNVDGLQESLITNFLTKAEQIHSAIEEFESKVKSIQLEYRSVLFNPFADEETKKTLEQHAAELYRNANRISTDLKGMIRDIKTRCAETASEADIRVYETQYTTLRSRFVSAMEEYMKCQVEYKDGWKERIRRQFMIAGQVITEEEIEEMLDRPESFRVGFVVDTSKAKQTLSDIEARNAEIEKVEKSIQEMHNMFVDFSILVQQQGKVIDRIESRIIRSKTAVEKGNTRLQKARKFKKRCRRTLFYGMVEDSA